jgi:hypothetical protein
MFHFYDPLPNTDDVTASVAVHECQTCGKACEELHDLPRWNFKACDACAEEAARADERETREVREFLVADGWTPFENGLSQDDAYIDLSRDYGFTWELKYFDGEGWSKPTEGDTLDELKVALGIIAYCSNCHVEVDPDELSKRSKMCPACAREASREFWLSVKAGGRY